MSYLNNNTNNKNLADRLSAQSNSHMECNETHTYYHERHASYNFQFFTANEVQPLSTRYISRSYIITYSNSPGSNSIDTEVLPLKGGTSRGPTSVLTPTGFSRCSCGRWYGGISEFRGMCWQPLVGSLRCRATSQYTLGENTSA